MKAPLLFLFTLFLVSPVLSQLCNQDDETTLLQIQKSLNNPRILSSWTPKTDCCANWAGIQCSNGRVTALTVSSGRLSGRIPAQVGDLPFLKTLEFSFLSNLNGELPPAIAKLKNLDLLRITRTNVSGSVPEFISQLKELTFLDLSFNDLTGPIPSSLSSMPKLEAIQLNDNTLTGSIPISFGAFQGNVPNLYLFNNRLSGTIPQSLSKYDFNAVDLSGNRFRGDGSMFFGRNKTTVRVDLSRNEFAFDLSYVNFPKSLLSLDLSHNRIFGKLPQGLTALRGLSYFNVSYNRLCGRIPRGGRLQSFNATAFYHNRCLCGAPLGGCGRS